MTRSDEDTMRRSAGITSPLRSTTTSPGTRSCGGTSRSSGSSSLSARRRTVTVEMTRCRKPRVARTARVLCQIRKGQRPPRSQKPSTRLARRRQQRTQHRDQPTGTRRGSARLADPGREPLVVQPGRFVVTAPAQTVSCLAFGQAARRAVHPAEDREHRRVRQIPPSRIVGERDVVPARSGRQRSRSWSFSKAWQYLRCKRRHLG